MKLHPYTGLIWLTVFYILVALAVLVIAFAWPRAEGAEVPPANSTPPPKVEVPLAPLTIPDDATLYGGTMLPCSGAMLFYDGNKNPEDGFEYVAVIKSGEPEPRAIFQYAPNDGGEFLRGVVRIPRKPEEPFTTAESMSAAYPHPCDILNALGPTKA